MKWLLKIARGIDRLNESVGRLVGWLTLTMVLVGAYNTLARYLGRWTGGNLSSNAYIELQWYLFSLVFLLGAAYTLRRGAHVRVDVMYGRLSPRRRTWVDLVGHVFLLLPFCFFGLWVCWPSVRNSWQVREISPDPGGLLRYPIKAMILVAFVLLILQGIAEIIRCVRILRGEREAETTHSEGLV